ncbi:hypothetical protein [Streptomyces sp. SGAir0957]
MPMANEHLATAEQLAAEALTWLRDGQLELARDYRGIAELYLRLADTRYTVIGSTPPPAEPPVELPQWCGNCDGPDLHTRWVLNTGADGRERMHRCPDCNPYAVAQRDVPRQAASDSQVRDNPEGADAVEGKETARERDLKQSIEGVGRTPVTDGSPS